MRKDQEDRLDPNKPTLIVLCGATKRKYRALDDDLTVIGRGPTCTIGLVSPEVAPVHCLIVRLADGWRIRDCSGRATRVNGRAITDDPLHNGDVIQIGAFSFEAHLPPMAAVVPAGVFAPSAALSERQQASRRRLVQRALFLRQRLREANDRVTNLARRERDLEQLERRLRSQFQDRQHSHKADAENAQAQLEMRKIELDHFARHLRRQEQKLREQVEEQARQVETDHAGYEADLHKARVELDRERDHLADLRRKMEQRHAEVEQTARLLEAELSNEREQLERDQDQVMRERSYLDQQRQELMRLRDDLQRRQTDEVPVAVAANETQLDAVPDRLASARRLLQQLAERRKALTQTPATTETA